MRKILYSLLLFFSTLGLAQAPNGIADSNQDFLAPECYYVKRTKKHGGKQSGMLYGFRLGYERIKRYKYYLGFEGSYAQGILKGRRGDNRIRSDLTDVSFEARFGYTFQAKCGMRPSFTPYVGAGYFWERNRYKHPSPIHPHFTNRFVYVPFGFLSHLYLTEEIGIGLNAKGRFLIDSVCRVTHDAACRDHDQHYEHEIHYRIELPVTYDVALGCIPSAFSLVPFFEHRIYGYKINFPHDFIETHYRIYGAELKYSYLF